MDTQTADETPRVPRVLFDANALMIITHNLNVPEYVSAPEITGWLEQYRVLTGKIFPKNTVNENITTFFPNS